MLDAQAVDVGIVSDALGGKMPAKIGAIGANLLGELDNGNVVLQIELLFLAVLLQQHPDVVVDSGRQTIIFRKLRGDRFVLRIVNGNGRVGRHLDIQVAQRFNPPHEIADKDDVGHLKDEVVSRATNFEGIDGKCQQNDGQHHKALPHLFVLQIGVVVAQPASVLPHRTYHIYYYANDHQQEIGQQQRQEGTATVGYAPRNSDNNRHHHHPNKLKI